MTETDRVTALIECQQRAVLSSSPPSIDERRNRLDRVRRLLARNADALAEAMDADFGGRDATFSKMNDLLACAMSLEATAKGLAKWARPSRRSTTIPFSLFGARSEVTYGPRGVIGIIGSWNAPLYTLIAPLSSVFAAGNRAILKPSEFVPATGNLLARLVAEEFAPAELAVVTGGAETAQALAGGPVDLIVFTGGAETGRKVMITAAQRLTPVILELGGKSPVILSRSANLVEAAHRIALGKGANSGQLCIAPDTIHVPREQVEPFCRELLAQYETHFGAMGFTAALVNEHHRHRFDSLLEDAERHGAQVRRLSAAADGTRRMPFTVVLEPPPAARIAGEEIFGPAVVVFGYDDIDELAARLKRQEKPLALYYFGNDRAEESRLLEQLPSGGATINEVLMHASSFDAPFGGAGRSGMGCFHGREGFEAMSHVRTVFRAGWWDPRKALGMLPPYSDKLREMIDATLKRAAR